MTGPASTDRVNYASICPISGPVLSDRPCMGWRPIRRISLIQNFQNYPLLSDLCGLSCLFTVSTTGVRQQALFID